MYMLISTICLFHIYISKHQAVHNMINIHNFMCKLKEKKKGCKGQEEEVRRKEEREKGKEGREQLETKEESIKRKGFVTDLTFIVYGEIIALI